MKEAVGFIIYRFDGKILLQHRTDDAPKYLSLWGFFSGGVEKGESPLEAVKREALEELNYNLVTENFRFKKVLKDKTVYVFVEKFDENQKLILNEGQGMG